MNKKNRLNLPAIMLIFTGLIIIIIGCLFIFLDPNITTEQGNNIIKIENI